MVVNAIGAEIVLRRDHGINRYIYLTSFLLPDIFIELIEASKILVTQFALGMVTAKD